jgi:hypothetical protein
MRQFRLAQFGMRQFSTRQFAGLLTPIPPTYPATGAGVGIAAVHRTLPWPTRRRRVGHKGDEVLLVLLHACEG